MQEKAVMYMCTIIFMGDKQMDCVHLPNPDVKREGWISLRTTAQMHRYGSNLPITGSYLQTILCFIYSAEL